MPREPGRDNFLPASGGQWIVAELPTEELALAAGEELALAAGEAESGPALFYETIEISSLQRAMGTMNGQIIKMSLMVTPNNNGGQLVVEQVTAIARALHQALHRMLENNDHLLSHVGWEITRGETTLHAYYSPTVAGIDPIGSNSDENITF